MDARALRYFQAVAEFGSHSRGAESLRISQPAVSRQIRSLEQELGRKLFDRHSHGVTLTGSGRLLLERSQAILRQIEQARADIRGDQTGPSGTVTLAVPPAAGTFLVPELARRFGAAYPNVFLKVVAGFSGLTQEWLQRGQVDLACLHDPVPQPGFVVTPLLREEVFLVGRADAPHAPGGPVSPEDLAGVPLILPGRPNASRRLLDQWLSRKGLLLDVRVEADDHLVIRALLQGGLGFSLLTQGAFRSETTKGGLQAWRLRPRAFWQLALMEQTAERRGGPASGLATVLRDTARDLLRRHQWHGATPVA